MSENLREQLLEKYCQITPKSRIYSESARNYIGGATTRDLTFFEPYPPYIVRGEGYRIIDVDRNEWIDFFNNATSLILGHANPEVVKAVQEQVAMGTAFHGPTILEVELAKLICERIRSVARVRFTNSGSEAVMMALRVARAFTGKNKIGKFEGGYHGICEHMSVSVHPDLSRAGRAEAPKSVPESPGVSKNILKEVVVMPFNKSYAVEKIVKKEKDDLACIIVEPMLGAAGIIPAKKGFLNDLRQITEETGVLLIFDEVQTFRQSWGGAQELANITPDLTVLAKVIGGGFPVGAFGGKKEIMEVFDSSKGKFHIPHGGTFNGNPVTMTAGIATLMQLTRQSYLRLNELGEELRRGLSELIQQYNYKGCVTGETSFFAFHLTDQEIWDYRDAIKCVNKVEQEKLFFHFLNGGIFLASTLRGNLSMPMGKPQIHKLLNVFEDYLAKRE